VLLGCSGALSIYTVHQYTSYASIRGPQEPKGKRWQANSYVLIYLSRVLPLPESLPLNDVDEECVLESLVHLSFVERALSGSSFGGSQAHGELATHLRQYDEGLRR
jgi:hypothetical protein